VFLFSGRPNPEWELSPALYDQWKVLWEKASLTDKETERPSILGYTGCRLQLSGSGYWLVYNGRVTFYNDTVKISKEDTERKMEFFLLHTAPTEITLILRQTSVL
jgi:hypothetical protein